MRGSPSPRWWRPWSRSCTGRRGNSRGNAAAPQPGHRPPERPGDTLPRRALGVDAQSRQYMLDMIRKINTERGTTILYTSHYINEIEQISDDIVILDEAASSWTTPRSASSRRATPWRSAWTRRPPASWMTSRASGASPARRAPSTFEKDDRFSSNMIRAMSVLRDHNIGIQDMRYGTSRLRGLYLHRPSTRLRDGE